MIRKNASVAFEMDCQNALQHGETACTHSYYYASVLGEGKAEILEGDEKRKGLSALMLHMAGRNDVFLSPSRKPDTSFPNSAALHANAMCCKP